VGGVFFFLFLFLLGDEGRGGGGAGRGGKWQEDSMDTGAKE
jgi:hypothetical protein